ncbi:hypothetical protein [Kitasatospora sp. A2-31]|uniref:hypothetical protein n=1 Tax=Kitasatospora sp. A2-31 TaxID=2916414 RepID=UPI001EEB7AEE|nr:hypothetical protein [Kitasatospora sp. A2-31]MCG6497132.1 hypothetical protein [Kitasatospora sp. A2-31]
MSTSVTVLNGRTIGLAHYATRAVAETVFESLGLTFHQEVAINGLGDRPGGGATRDDLITRLTTGLKIDDAAAAAVIEQLLDAGLATASGGDGGDPAVLALTDTGRELHGRIQDGVKRIVARIYGDLPAEDLAVAARVLTVVTERANAILAEA